MAHRCVRKLGLASASSFVRVRHLHYTTARLEALAVPPAEHSAAASSSSTPPRNRPLDVLLKQKTAELRALVSLKSPSPHRVWASYTELVQVYGSAKVPRDIHQGVLRKCAPRAADLRAVSARLMEEGSRFKDGALYEARFRNVIRNLRASGEMPSLEDYHCVLEHFAAVGNHRGAMMVLNEITQVGLPKNAETYGLCLQALSFRLTLPVWHLNRPALVDEITGYCVKLLEEMSVNNVPYTARNVDFAFRILKETMSMEGFTALMRGAYGLDLSYPDRSPLEFWAKKVRDSTESGTPDDLVRRLPTRLPFSLAAFNTALDYLGRAGNISKMVQLFEVVTTPLPSSTSNPSFDDDEDDDFGYSNPQVAPYSPPHLQPNTTTFHTMLRHIHRASHETLARHYLLVAMEMERDQGRSLREHMRTKPPQEIFAPRISITRSLLLAVASVANDNKDVELLRWVANKTKRTARRKRFDLAYCTQVRAKWIEDGLYQPVALSDAALEGVEEDLPLGPVSSRFSGFFSPSFSHREGFGNGAPGSQDLSAPPSSEEPKPFNIDLHMNILRRDLEKLERFQRRVDDVLARAVQRVKERLGRRVWGGKDVFLRDVEGRMTVSKDFWRERVNFRPRSAVRVQGAASAGRRPSREPPHSRAEEHTQDSRDSPAHSPAALASSTVPAPPKSSGEP